MISNYNENCLTFLAFSYSRIICIQHICCIYHSGILLWISSARIALINNNKWIQNPFTYVRQSVAFQFGALLQLVFLLLKKKTMCTFGFLSAKLTDKVMLQVLKEEQKKKQNYYPWFSFISFSFCFSKPNEQIPTQKANVWISKLWVDSTTRLILSCLFT